MSDLEIQRLRRELAATGDPHVEFELRKALVRAGRPEEAWPLRAGDLVHVQENHSPWIRSENGWLGVARQVRFVRPDQVRRREDGSLDLVSGAKPMVAWRPGKIFWDAYVFPVGSYDSFWRVRPSDAAQETRKKGLYLSEVDTLTLVEPVDETGPVDVQKIFQRAQRRYGGSW